MARRFGKSGSEAEKNFRKLCESYGIALEDGSPSKSSDFSIFPNILAEVKSTTENSFSFKQGHAKGKELARSEKQWKNLKEKSEEFPWLEVVYPVYYSKKKEWKWFRIPDEPTPLNFKRGMQIESLMDIICKRQREFRAWLESTTPLENQPEMAAKIFS